MKISDEIKKASALIRDVVYIGGLVVAIYLFTGKKAVEKDRSIQQEIALEKKVDLLITSDSVRKMQDRNLSDTLKIVVEKQNLMIKEQGKTKKGLVELYKLTGKVEELVSWWF
jgi:hypothetical protein